MRVRDRDERREDEGDDEGEPDAEHDPLGFVGRAPDSCRAIGTQWRIRRSLLALALLIACLIGTRPDAAAAATPTLFVSPIVTGLDHPWDVGIASDGTMFFTERPGRLWVFPRNGTAHPLNADMSDLWVSGETGLMGVEPDPQFTSNRRVYTCQGTTDSGDTVQVVAWQVDAGFTTATRVADPLVGGIDGTSGRHGGCQLRIDNAGALIVGTGDAAAGTNPQDTFALAGKTLRVDRFSGAGLPGNPFFNGGGDPRVQTIGHRNVQGLALQPGTGTVWSVEHGPDRDDEINRITAGANYGWNPVPGYNETVPMTAPGATPAAWSSGIPTLATSGATFLRGPDWGDWQGALAVSALKDSTLRIFSVSGNTATLVATPAALNGTHGRLRAAEMGPDGVLYLTTDNGATDKILAVAPRIDKGGVSVESSGANRIDQVARGFDNAIWERHGTPSLSGWSSLGGISTSDPDLASWGPGRLDVFVRGIDGAVWHKGANSNTFVPNWDTLGGLVTSGPSATSWASNRIDVFVRGIDGALWANGWTGASWSGWYPLGGQIVGDPDVASFAPNRLDVFARGTDGAMWHRAWTGVTWTPWQSLGGAFTSGPGATSLANNRVDVFGRGTDGALWSKAWTGSGWTGWFTLGGGLVGDPDAVSKSAGTQDVVIRGLDNGVWQRSFNGATWGPWIRTG